MRMYVIYHNSSDFPGMFVARGQTLQGGKVIADPEPLIVTSDLENARNEIQFHTECSWPIPRHPNDEPQIVETWV